jgi:hypothetical protein
MCFISVALRFMARYPLLKPFFSTENSELKSKHLYRHDLNFVTEESIRFETENVKWPIKLSSLSFLYKLISSGVKV